MISVYVNKYKPIEGSEQWGDGNTEALLFTIPNQNGDTRPVLGFTVDNDVTSSGNCEFTLDVKNIWYDIWKHMRTLVRVEYDGDTIFYGRVLTIDRDMFRTKKIHCEGAITFFKDSMFLGKKNGSAMTLNAYLKTLIDAHNECMKDIPEKHIFLGEVPGNYTAAVTEHQQIPNDSQKYGEEGYKDIKACLDTLLSDYGGYMRVRYNSTDEKMYLDWMKLYFRNTVNSQEISVHTNTLDLSDTVEVNNIFTHVIPVGKNNKYIDGNSGGGSGSGSGNDTSAHKITITKTGSEAGHPSADPAEASKGTLIQLKANPMDTAKFIEWSVTSGNVEIVYPYYEETTFTMGSEDVVIAAKYEGGGIDPEKKTITLQPGGSKSGEPTSSLSAADPGVKVYITANPTNGATFKNWVVVSGGISLNNIFDATTYFTTGDYDVVIAAIYEGGVTPPSPDEHTLSLTKGGTGDGSVSASKGTAEEGEIIWITATPDENSSFYRWELMSGDCEIAGPTIRKTYVIMHSQDCIVRARFVDVLPD